MEKILEQARKKYPKGSFFFTTTGKVISPMMVTFLRVAENYKNTIVNDTGGIIYDNGTWARKF